MVCLWINQPPQIWTMHFCSPHQNLIISRFQRSTMRNSRRGWRVEEVKEVEVQEGPSLVPLSHIKLRKKLSSVKLREWSVPHIPAGSTEGAFVHHHLAPITARQNCFSAVGRRVNGPGVGCEERPCPHTPTKGQGLIGSLWCGGWDFGNL